MVKKLIQKMLNTNFEERISAAEALSSPWFSGKASIVEDSKDIRTVMVKNLENFHVSIILFQFKNKLKSVIYTYIATQLYSDKEK